ncbi:MAG TPA: class D beta-lactamase [Cyanobacteria bacterium UBA11149]|nr:class D beta-lactamase [Cyanobacteria bacterium UBA11367]HBE59427.1 class D beta-lactamase [Cyanobacteria bacterium UBA11366]HBR75212.1 class D beta-lactamase [Cyanobacteria bacterium UBA11159]HBS68932.1 class D beta-lactamase [Cyanobacteria bacterium UBA11153]HBW90680.1 class D beta-lactamase [Cyanobacteria bacterium UBA11149]HCA97179.1 class D beta-lactamase [Cyanobacteria bacterium UBA9226]
MNRIVRLTIIVLISCISTILILSQTMEPGLTTPKSIIETSPPINIAQNINLGRHFQDLGVEGSIMIYDSKNNHIFEHNPQRNRTAFPVASTFKILNSLIALETQVIADEIAILTWDGITREFPGWNRDLNMREAFKLSAVWFYQVLARRVGYERMEKWINQVGYGNQQIGDKNDIDRFWLNGKLQITPQEQIEFIRRLYQNKLPFSERSIAIVKDIMIVEKTPEYTIRAKTGWFGFGDDSKEQIGWYVGYIEKGNNIYFFATNIDMRNEKDPAARIELTRRCFQDLAVL